MGHWELELLLLPNRKVTVAPLLLPMVMVLQIKDKFMRVLICLNYGNYQLFIFAKTIDMAWEHRQNVLQHVLIFILAVIIFLALLWMAWMFWLFVRRQDLQHGILGILDQL